MGSSPKEPDLHPLADLDQVIHAPARLMVLTYLYVVDSADYVFLVNITGLSWGNLATHLGKLEEAGYIAIEKEKRGRKTYSMVHLTPHGREAFSAYRDQLQDVLSGLPEK